MCKQNLLRGSAQKKTVKNGTCKLVVLDKKKLLLDFGEVTGGR